MHALELVWKRCESCGVIFHSPTWVKQCFICGGDPIADAKVAIAAVLVFVIAELIVRVAF